MWRFAWWATQSVGSSSNMSELPLVGGSDRRVLRVGFLGFWTSSVDRIQKRTRHRFGNWTETPHHAVRPSTSHGLSNFSLLGSSFLFVSLSSWCPVAYSFYICVSFHSRYVPTFQFFPFSSNPLRSENKELRLE